MQHFKHPHVVPLLGLAIKDNIPYVVVPFMENGDLRCYVKKETNVRNRSIFLLLSSCLNFRPVLHIVTCQGSGVSHYTAKFPAYEPAVDLWSNTNAMEIPPMYSPLLVLNLSNLI